MCISLRQVEQDLVRAFYRRGNGGCKGKLLACSRSLSELDKGWSRGILQVQQGKLKASVHLFSSAFLHTFFIYAK